MHFLLLILVSGRFRKIIKKIYLRTLLGSIVRDYNAFSITYSSFRKIPKDYKRNILKNTI